MKKIIVLLMKLMATLDEGKVCCCIVHECYRNKFCKKDFLCLNKDMEITSSPTHKDYKKLMNYQLITWINNF